MLPNNNICGVGVAFGAKIGAIRMLDGRIDDRVEGVSLQYAIDK
jgi:proprotein convertase subtilisin/kexin type 1